MPLGRLGVPTSSKKVQSALREVYRRTWDDQVKEKDDQKAKLQEESRRLREKLEAEGTDAAQTEGEKKKQAREDARDVLRFNRERLEEANKRKEEEKNASGAFGVLLDESKRTPPLHSVHIDPKKLSASLRQQVGGPLFRFGLDCCRG